MQMRAIGAAALAALLATTPACDSSSAAEHSPLPAGKGAPPRYIGFSAGAGPMSAPGGHAVAGGTLAPSEDGRTSARGVEDGDVRAETRAPGAGAIVLTAFGAGPARAASPLTYSGYLLDSSGKPVSSACIVHFKFYDAETGGTMKWEDVLTVVPDSHGQFRALIGAAAVNPLPVATITGLPLWVALQIEGDAAEMSPRLRVRRVRDPSGQFARPMFGAAHRRDDMARRVRGPGSSPAGSRRARGSRSSRGDSV